MEGTTRKCLEDACQLLRRLNQCLCEDIEPSVDLISATIAQLQRASDGVALIPSATVSSRVAASEQPCLQAIFDAVNVGMQLIAEDGTVKRVNNVVLRWVGSGKPAVEDSRPGEALNCIHVANDGTRCGQTSNCARCPIRNTFESVLRSGLAIHDAEAEVTLLINGAAVKLWLELSADPVIIGGRRHVILAMNDITRRKRAEGALRQMAKDLARSNQELEHFAHIASHDLQEPLRTVAAFLNLLKDRYQGMLDDRAHEYIGHAVDGAHRMSQQIRDLLTYSQVGRVYEEQRTFDADESLSAALANLTLSIEESGAVVTRDPLPMVFCAPPQLTQVFQNLISNAIKFRSKSVQPQIHVSVEEHPDVWKFSVRDNGIGIATEHHERIFGVFQRLHTRIEYAGTGIGLSVCKKIVENQGGRIWLDSEPRKGSTFFFTILKQEVALSNGSSKIKENL